VDPKKNMTFNPQESIDFNGNTGPFIQYTHARVRSILRKAEEQGIALPEQIGCRRVAIRKRKGWCNCSPSSGPSVKQAGSEYNVSLIGNYVYDLAKEFNQFYHDHPILREENASLRDFRLLLCQERGTHHQERDETIRHRRAGTDVVNDIGLPFT
jgi:arginyl-tRNA synthetase